MVDEHPGLVRAFVPAHITAFFVPVLDEDPLRSGSLGAGVNLTDGTTVFTSVEVTGWDESKIHVAFNGEPVSKDEAVISYSVAERLIPAEFKGEVEVWQYFDFPNGYGFGNSAGGALGTALTLGYLFGGTLLNVSRVAHAAEVENGGGLGDVIAQLAGGVEVRVTAGGPGVGVVDNILTHDLKVVSAYLGPIKTREVLDEDVLDDIKREGKVALEKLMHDPRVPVMMRVARRFAERTGLMDGELRSLALEMDRVLSIRTSMIMLGKGLFAFVRAKELPSLEALLKDLNVPYRVSGVYWGKPVVGTWKG